MAKSEFYITDGNKFIKQNTDNQYKTVSNFALADGWDNGQVAKSILNNSIPKALRSTFYVAKYENGQFIKWCLTNSEKQTNRDEITHQNKDNKCYNLDLYSFENDTDLQGIVSGFEMVDAILKQTDGMHFKLQKELTTLDLMLEDLKHYRLRRKLGTVDSYKFKKLGDDILLKRVSIKNQLEILNKINQYRFHIGEEVEDICKTINCVKNRKYVPRVLVDLYENDNLDIEVAL